MVRCKYSRPEYRHTQLMILRVRIQHEPLARQAGLNISHLSLIRDVSVVPANLEAMHRGLREELSPLQAVALVYTDYVTRAIAVPQAVFDALRSNLENDQQIFEVTATASAYNMVSRILVALDVGEKAAADVPVPV